MSQPIDLCLADFLERFFRDIYVGEPNLGELIGLRVLFDVFGYYDDHKPTTSLSSIATDFKNCIEPEIGSAAIITATQLGDAIFYIVILTAVFMILVVVILGLIDKTKQPELIVALILFFALIYIIVGWLLIHNSFLIISNEITNIEAVTDKCVQNAIDETELFFTAQEEAINAALCNYPDSPL